MSGQTDHSEQMRDELLVVRCQLGEEAAFEELVAQWSGRLVQHLRRTAGHEVAEDLSQEVWIRALRGISRLREGKKLRAWLFGIAHNVTMDRFRAHFAETAMLEAASDLPEPDPIDETEARSLILAQELAHLPLVEREALTLFYLEELSLAELAVVQTVPLGTAKSRLFRARRMLRKAMLEGSANG